MVLRDCEDWESSWAFSGPPVPQGSPEALADISVVTSPYPLVDSGVGLVTGGSVIVLVCVCVCARAHACVNECFNIE